MSGLPDLASSTLTRPDNATGKLMVALYQNLVKEEAADYVSALHSAKMELLSDPKTAFPKNWSGFVLLGQ